MSSKCPTGRIGCKKSGQVVRYGSFYRTSDRRKIQRYKCTHCGVYFSQATASPCFGQKKRQINHRIFELLSSSTSQRRLAKLLKVHPITIARKLEFMGLKAKLNNYRMRQERKKSKVVVFQFDDQETFEHTKLKPLSITVAVESKTRFILGFEVSRMPAKGHLAKRSRKKYGPRKDERAEARDRLFRRIQPVISEAVIIQSDQNPHYKNDVDRYFPKATYVQSPGGRGCVVGQGELKALGFDPLFTINHALAMFRDDVKRLARKTWCTTKKPSALSDLLDLYTYYYNTQLI